MTSPNAEASVDGAVLIRHTTGKDRTGMVIALIHSAVDVERDYVVRDNNTLSETRLIGAWTERLLQRVSVYGIDLISGLIELVNRAKARVIVGPLEDLDTRYGCAV